MANVVVHAYRAEHGFEPRHMSRQLEQSLDNLRTDHLDIYAFHHPNFGADDRWLQPALEAMRAFRDDGLIKTIGMRGPHRFALDRLTTPPDQRGDKIARFRALFDIVQPDIPGDQRQPSNTIPSVREYSSPPSPNLQSPISQTCGSHNPATGRLRYKRCDEATLMSTTSTRRFLPKKGPENRSLATVIGL